MNTSSHGELHAQLVSPHDDVRMPQRQGGAVVVATSLQTAPTSGHTSAPGEERRPTTAAMLLAALALMTGIALRRWGAGQQ